MRERRFLVAEIPSGRDVDIVGAEAHHLLHVLRLRPGDEIVVFDGRGKEFRAVLTRCEKSSAAATALEPLASRESPLELTVAVAVPKMDSMSRIVQKLTELGAHRLIPLQTDRSVVTSRRAAHQLSRWRRIAAEACKQSGRAVVPTVAEPLAFAELLEADLPARRFLLTVGGPSLGEQDRPSSCLLAIGPEGGWTEEEVASALAKGFQPLGLGSRTLRTETAALAAVAVLEWLWGD
jgi:16S rRNA (uracil1498-N3)-methyltransferase